MSTAQQCIPVVTFSVNCLNPVEPGLTGFKQLINFVSSSWFPAKSVDQLIVEQSNFEQFTPTCQVPHNLCATLNSLFARLTLSRLFLGLQLQLKMIWQTLFSIGYWGDDRHFYNTVKVLKVSSENCFPFFTNYTLIYIPYFDLTLF